MCNFFPLDCKVMNIAFTFFKVLMVFVFFPHNAETWGGGGWRRSIFDSWRLPSYYQPAGMSPWGTQTVSQNVNIGWGLFTMAAEQNESQSMNWSDQRFKKRNPVWLQKWPNITLPCKWLLFLLQWQLLNCSSHQLNKNEDVPSWECPYFLTAPNPWTEPRFLSPTPERLTLVWIHNNPS